MNLHFQYNKQEVIAALRFHFINRPEIRFFRILLVLTLIFSFVGYFTDVLTLKMLISIFLLFVVLLLFFWYILPFSVYRRAATFKEPEIKLQCTADMLVVMTGRGENRMPWERFHTVIETKNWFYLYRSNKSFFLIPAHAFADREERVAFSEMLQNRIADYHFK